MKTNFIIKIGNKGFTYDMLKEFLTIQMIPIAGNEERLETMPHIRIFDIAATYHFVIDEKDPLLDFYVTTEMLEAFGVSAQQIHKDALENSSKRFLMRFYSASEKNGGTSDVSDDTMYFVTTNALYNGASCLFYPEFEEEAIDRLGVSFYIFPVSIHELILVKEEEASPDVLKTIERECNKIEPDEYLSDSGYYYDAKSHRLLFSKKRSSRVSQRTYEAICEGRDWLQELFERNDYCVSDVYSLMHRILNEKRLCITGKLALLTVLGAGRVVGSISARFMMPPILVCCDEYSRIKKEFRKGFTSTVVYDDISNVTARVRIDKYGKVNLKVSPYFCKDHSKHQKAYLHKQDFGWLCPSMRLI